jgi:N-acetylated-alpha-linked acidic dipeptidase
MPSRNHFIAVLLCAPITFGQIRGFLADQLDAEKALETKLRSIPDAERIRGYAKRMSADPHLAGTPASKANAEYALGFFREWGIDAHIETFQALMPYPTKRVLELVEPNRYVAKLKEPAIQGDATSGQPGQVPTYNAYSASGSVTALLVYVNYGVPEDYEELAKLGIDVKGKIVIARYGKSWRGVKPKVAYEHGALACIIYSDPRDDGFFQGDAYPKGAFRPAEGVQRGSVIDMSIYPGDPLTPGWANEKGAKQLSRDEAKSLLKIPVLPISYADAEPLIAALSGPVAPEPWRGALPLTYHIGPGPAKVHLDLDFDWGVRPLYDVIATIPGDTWKDQWIVYGNHHDAWVNGADDPISGASALLETARTLASMLKDGWHPKRTITFALWDGEEFGLLGSTEWVEKHGAELAEHAVAYINSDSTGKGTLGGSGSATLERFLTEVARDIPDPMTPDKSVLDTAREKSKDKKEFHLGPLGSGSDYTAFVDHAGVASLNLGFSNAGGGGGVYHSIYDSPTWYSKFSDGDYRHGRALAQVMGISLVRLADAPVLPFEFARLAANVRTYAEEIEKLAAESKHSVDLAGVTAQAAVLEADSKDYESALARVQANRPPEKLGSLNRTLYQLEQSLSLPEGLPGRSWFKNQICAPGMYTGYGAKTLPGIREAVEAGRWDEANTEARKVATALRNFNARLEDATKLLRSVGD